MNCAIHNHSIVVIGILAIIVVWQGVRHVLQQVTIGNLVDMLGAKHDKLVIDAHDHRNGAKTGEPVAKPKLKTRAWTQKDHDEWVARMDTCLNGVKSNHHEPTQLDLFTDTNDDD